MSTAARRAREKQQRRVSIIDAAEKLFFSKGYDNVSMNDIAKEVELNRATIYLYFENKEALCFAVILRGVRLLNQMVRNRVKNTSYAQKINAFGNTYYHFFSLYPQYKQIYNLFQSGRFHISSLRRPAWDDVREILDLQKGLFNILHSAIKTEIGTGSISSDIEPDYAAILIISAIEGMINPSPILEKEIEDRNIKKYQDFRRNYIHFVGQLLKK
ncbi:MAG: DNA-binding transcriptional regulator EnvR [Methanobacterium sp. PtaU1.Bin242]|nr:MAG: DNA-binding transcriptional regulator EnvR [Methanobacterium sp. PtaU1.Bin242]